MREIEDIWREIGGISGPAGEPMGPVILNPDRRGSRQRFENGMIYYDPAARSGGYIPFGPIWDVFRRGGYERGALGYPKRFLPGSRVNAGELAVTEFAEGSAIDLRQSIPKLSEIRLLFLNTALINQKYGGRGRSRQVSRLIEVIREGRYNIVGLAEIFDDGERRDVRQALSDILPYYVDAPDESDLEEDGGLALLSSFPIGVRTQAIFRNSAWPDSLANKGIIHGRLTLSSKPEVHLDVYVTHMQAGHEDVKQNQAEAVDGFVNAVSGNRFPAIVLGDYNLNFNDEEKRSKYYSHLGKPVDLWLAAGKDKLNPLGITDDVGGSAYRAHEGAVAIDRRRRFKDGKRIDAALLYPATHGRFFVADSVTTKPFELVPGTGVDLSDHYGLEVVGSMNRIGSPFFLGGPLVDGVRVSRVHCLEDTSELGGTDQILGQMRARFDGGEWLSTGQVRLGSYSPGIIRDVRSGGLTLRLEGNGTVDPVALSQVAEIEVTLHEDDEGWFARDDLVGRPQISVDKRSLQLLGSRHSKRRELALPLLRGDSAEYVVWIEGVGG